MLDCPAIRNAMMTGYEDGIVPEIYTCPVCGACDIRDVYINENDELVGCDYCIRVREAYDIDWGRYT